MSLEKAKKYLADRGFLDHIIELDHSTATVSLAAEALGVEPGMIAKTLSFFQGETPVLILAEGTARIDNRKYKDTFHMKARMIPFEEVEAATGHAPGGVCPFGANENVKVYLDQSLRKFDTRKESQEAVSGGVSRHSRSSQDSSARCSRDSSARRALQ